MLSSVHFAFDARIFQKEARSLAQAGFEVTIIAREDPTSQKADKVRVLPLPKPKNRLRRMLGTLQVGLLALRQRADLYAFHDPELIPVGILLKLFTRSRVVYDIHEIVPQQILTKEWLPRPLRVIALKFYQLVENLALPLLDGLVLVVPGQLKYYPQYRTQTVMNFPLLNYASLQNGQEKAPTERPTLIYAGSVRKIRGLYEMLELVRRLKESYPDILLRLVGPIVPTGEEDKVRHLISAHEMDGNVELLGRVSHPEVHRQIARADLGLALIHPDPTYYDALFTKAFEYMMMSKPVIVSDIPLWREIIRENRCGLAVAPLNPEAVEAAVVQLLEDKELRREMGVRGREAVRSKYNWDVEGEKLVQCFQGLIRDIKD